MKTGFKHKYIEVFDRPSLKPSKPQKAKEIKSEEKG